MNGSLYTSIIERFCFDDFYFEDIRIKSQKSLSKATNSDYELVVFNTKKILFFAALDDGISSADAVFMLRHALNSIVVTLSLSLNDFTVCGANQDFYFFLNKYNDKLFVFSRYSDEENALIEHIKNECCYGVDCFDYDSIKALSDTLTLSVNPTFTGSVQKVKTTSDGKTFLYKHGMWREASELNTEIIYPLTALGGMLGLHLFYQKKRAKGIIYFLTFGFCGIGWFFDCVELLFGLYKDEDGKYLVPLENKTVGFIMFMLGGLMFAGIILFLVFFGKFIFNDFQFLKL